MNKRNPITKKIRFEVFKRDSFRCQYCGAEAPDVTLEVDHIQPIKEGGTNDLSNLITACSKCNRGKGARLLSDNSLVKVQKKQLDELNKRREQLEMMMEWRKELMNLENEKLNHCKNLFEKLANVNLSKCAINELKKLVKKYDFEIIIDSIEASIAQYLIPNEDGTGYTVDSIGKAFTYIEKICRVKTINRDNPQIEELFYIRGIMRNRFSYCDERLAFNMLKTAYLNGTPIEKLKEIALSVKNWTNWCSEMESLVSR